MSLEVLQNIALFGLFALFAFFLCGLAIFSGMYVYFDAKKRTQSRLTAAALTAAVFMTCWPLSFLVYLWCIAKMDSKRRTFSHN
jgi:amino acid permease